MQTPRRRERLPGITCRELVRFLDEHLAGSLPREEQAEFERHLAVCPPCVRYLENYRAAIRLGKSAFRCEDERLPRRVPGALVKAILAARRRRQGGRRGS